MFRITIPAEYSNIQDKYSSYIQDYIKVLRNECKEKNTGSPGKPDKKMRSIKDCRYGADYVIITPYDDNVEARRWGPALVGQGLNYHNDIDFQELSCSKILKVLGRWFGRNPFSKGFLPRSFFCPATNYLEIYNSYHPLSFKKSKITHAKNWNHHYRAS